MEDQKPGKQCQSCGMPLKDGEVCGTNADGSKNHEYCHLCYENGAFKTPDMTLDQMKEISNSALKEKGWIAPLRWMAMWQLPTLKRWKK